MNEQIALDVSVYIPGMQVVSGALNVMKILNAIPKDIIKLKQDAIALLAPRLQYAIPPLEKLKNRSDESLWDPPFKDAVDLTLDGMFTRVGKVLRNEPTNIPRILLSETMWKNRYETVRIQKPNMDNFKF